MQMMPQHHLTETGWLWMLRFNNGITSVGLTEWIGANVAENSAIISTTALHNESQSFLASSKITLHLRK